MRRSRSRSSRHERRRHQSPYDQEEGEIHRSSSKKVYKSATTSALIESDPFRRHKDLLKYSLIRLLAELKLAEATRPDLALTCHAASLRSGSLKGNSMSRYMLERSTQATLSESDGGKATKAQNNFGKLVEEARFAESVGGWEVLERIRALNLGG